MTTVVSALISAAVTLVVCLVTQHAQSVKDRTVIEMKLDELSRRVSKHNTLVERMYAAEQRVELQEERINILNHRISDMEEASKHE